MSLTYTSKTSAKNSLPATRKSWLPFGAKGIASKPNSFRQALGRLTLIYTGILIIQMTISGFTTYNLFDARIDVAFSSFDSGVLSESFDQEVVRKVVEELQERAQQELAASILIGRVMMLGVGAFLAYLLARATIRPVEDASNRQSLFLSNASHELRTPIAILRTNLENELHRSNDAKYQARITGNLEEVSRISDLVESLMLLARLNEPREVIPVTESVPLHELIDQVVERFVPLAEKHHVRLKTGALEALTVQTKPEILLHAIDNVIKNAILYNREHGTVTISLQKTTDSAVMHIVDTGIGIPQEALNTIFDRFTRAETSRSRDAGGSGLGLAIAQSSLQQIGGTIAIAATSDQGTNITITLPRRR
jgi:two-component system, OmpR family, sensor histidine kinase CiaH